MPKLSIQDQIRRGETAGGEKFGCAEELVSGSSDVVIRGWLLIGSTARVVANETCKAGGFTNGPRMVGILLQQFWSLRPCGEHGIEPQHCMACSLVVIAPQSRA